jgi:hypothetical protein
MPDKKICLYDSSNTPLQVAGIRVELYDASTKAYIDGDDSDDLNMAAHPSDTWGVVLKFPSGATPVDIYISDPTYKYPGNTMRYLNGDLRDDVLMDLMQLPAGPGGQQPPPSPATVPQINAWVDGGNDWTHEEREAVRNLIFNFGRALAPGAEDSPSTHFDELKGNWETAMKRVGFKPELLEGLRPRGTAMA